jgi:hypothetical protein
MVITGIGFEDEAKDQYIGMLKTVNVNIRLEDKEKYTIKQLQDLLERNKNRGK